MKEKRGKLSYLFLCLFLLLFIYPIVEGSALGGKLLALFFSFILVAGVYAVSNHSRLRLIISVSLATVSVILVWFDQIFPSTQIEILDFLFMSFFCFFTVFCLIRFLMNAKKVTADILAGAASAYLLLGISWSMLCGLLELINPGSFAISGPIGPDALTKWATFNYYSFTTLTTLGYGDITPVSGRAQSLAILEAATGVLFIALLISRLVGMYLHQLQKEQPE